MDSFAQKVSHLKSLYHLATVDGIYSKSEAVYIKNVAERLGVDLDKIDLTASENKLTLPDKEYKLYALFHRLAIIIMVDNEVTKSEKEYCIKLGIRMGLHPNAVTEVIDYVAKKGNVFHSPVEVINIFKKYMN